MKLGLETASALRSAVVQAHLDLSLARKRHLHAVSGRFGSGRSRRVFLVGDSLARGYVAGRYELVADASTPLRFIDQTFNLIASENSSTLECYYVGSADADAVQQIADFGSPGDLIVVLDAGPRPSCPDAIEARAAALLLAARDYGFQPGIFLNIDAHGTPDRARYEAELRPGCTPNSSLRRAARTAKALLIDPRSALSHCPPPDAILQDDGVHLTLLGSVLYAALLVRVVIQAPLESLAWLAPHLAATRRALSASPSPDSSGGEQTAWLREAANAHVTARAR